MSVDVCPSGFLFPFFLIECLLRYGCTSLSFLAPEKHYESVCYLQKWKMTHIVLLSRSILPQPHRKSFFGAKITNLYAERFILTLFLDMIVQFFYFYTRTAVFFRMWTQTGWLVNLSVFLSIGTKNLRMPASCADNVRRFFLNIRTKSRSFCTNIRVNFLMFTSTFQLFFPSGCLFGSPCLRKAASES